MARPCPSYRAEYQGCFLKNYSWYGQIIDPVCKTDKTDNYIQHLVCLIRLMYHVSNRLVTSSLDSKQTLKL